MEASANRPDDFRHVTRAAEQLARTLTTDRRLNPPKSNVAWDGLIQMITDLVPNFFEDDTGLTRSGRSVDPPVTPAKPPVIPAKAGIHDETTGPRKVLDPKMPFLPNEPKPDSVFLRVPPWQSLTKSSLAVDHKSRRVR
jgi:hypothetical protein